MQEPDAAAHRYMAPDSLIEFLKALKLCENQGHRTDYLRDALPAGQLKTIHIWELCITAEGSHASSSRS